MDQLVDRLGMFSPSSTYFFKGRKGSGGCARGRWGMSGAMDEIRLWGGGILELGKPVGSHSYCHPELRSFSITLNKRWAM